MPGGSHVSPPKPNSPPLWTWTFGTFLLINLIIFVGFNMLLPTLPLYLAEKGCSKENIGFIYAVFTITSVLSRVFASRLSYRFGALMVIRAGLWLCGLGTLMYFAFENQISYASARLLHGAGFGLTSALLVSLASQTIPSSRLGEGIGYLGMGAALALAIGPLAGLFMAEHFGYRAMFISISLCSITAILVSLALPQASLPSDSKDLSPAPLSILERKALVPSSLVFIYGLCASSITAYLALYLDEIKLSSIIDFYVVSTIGMLFSRTFAGRIFDRSGHQYVIPPCIIMILSSLLILFSVPGQKLLYFAAILYGLGLGGLFPSLQALALSSVPMNRRTSASAFFYNSFDIGMGLGSIFLGFLAGHFFTFRAVYGVAAIFLLILLFLYFFYYRHKQDPKAKKQ